MTDLATPNPQTALVTGGSSGIGLELARCFAKAHRRVIIVGKDEAKLARAADDLRGSGAHEVIAWSIDLAGEDGGARLFAKAQEHGEAIDYLALNAGSGAWGKFIGETDWKLELEGIQVNNISVVQAAKLFIPAMVQRGQGRVLITSSVVALGPSAKLAVYSATKAFLYTFAEALREELLDTGVSVTALMPDLTQSDFFERAGVDPDSITAKEPKADPAHVAEIGYDAMMKGRDHVVAPHLSAAKMAAASVLPTWLTTKFARAE